MADHVCPVWVGYLMANPLRKLVQNPDRILSAHVRPGMTVLDVGCAMGYFSVPLARLVGPDGRVVCVDVQERMLRSLEKRASKAGVRDRIEPRLSPPEGLGCDDLEGRVGFALAFAMVHEVPDRARLFAELHAALAPEGRLLVSEPRGHVNADAFAASVKLAEAAGFVVSDRPHIRSSHSVLLSKE